METHNTFLSRTRTVYVSRIVIFAVMMLLQADAWVATASDIRLDLELPGTSRSFVRLWTVGDNEQTAGIATDPAGRIFTTVSKNLLALAPDGTELWTFDCSALGGCDTVSTNFDAVFAGLTQIGVARVTSISGAIECVYQPGDLGTILAPQRLLATDSYVIIGSTNPQRVVVVDAATCTELYRLVSPNGESVGSLVADESNNNLVVSWDEAGTGSPEIVSYRLDNGNELCSYSREEIFRTLLINRQHLGGSGTLRGYSTDQCVEQVSFPGSFGDLRDIAYDASMNRIYMLGASSSIFGLWVLDATTLQQISFHSDFFDFGLLSLNKLAVGERWAFVPDGSTLDTGRIHVLDLDRVIDAEFATFELGRVTRLADRLVDGGLLLTQVQRGNVVNPDTPLMAFQVGVGDFVGQSYVYGTPLGNKHCNACLTELQYVEMICDVAPDPDSWSCRLQNLYEQDVSNITLAGLPVGTWTVREGGIVVGTGDGGAVDLSILVAASETRVLTIPEPATLALQITALLAAVLLAHQRQRHLAPKTSSTSHIDRWLDDKWNQKSPFLLNPRKTTRRDNVVVS